MKARSGFVSNSGSSSFVIIGKKVRRGEIKDFDHVWMIGDEYGEGTDAFELDDEAKDFILSNKMTRPAEYMSAVKTMYAEESSERLTENDLKVMLAMGGVDVYCFNKSQCDSFEQDDWKEMYFK